MNGKIDLRSDTVTTPTPEMRRAMAEAAVGDDVYGEDPTVNALQEETARVVGKEAALFVPSGTMGNQIAIHLHTRPGQEVILESRSHVLNYEMAMMAAFSGCQPRTFSTPSGHPEWTDIEAVLSPDIYYRAPSGLIVLENTHNFAGGTVLEPEQTREIAEAAHERGLKIHLDGARIFHAATALNCTVAELADPCDSVMFCLSKGLCAPVGSMLAGDTEFIERARSVRKMLGGGMRQAGVIAAAALVALRSMPARLRHDHENAHYLAQSITTLDGFEVDVENVKTNIVLVTPHHMTPDDFLWLLGERGVLASHGEPGQVRMVTHKDIGRQEIEHVISVLHQLAA